MSCRHYIPLDQLIGKGLCGPNHCPWRFSLHNFSDDSIRNYLCRCAGPQISLCWGGQEPPRMLLWDIVSLKAGSALGSRILSQVVAPSHGYTVVTILLANTTIHSTRECTPLYKIRPESNFLFDCILDVVKIVQILQDCGGALSNTSDNENC